MYVTKHRPNAEASHHRRSVVTKKVRQVEKTRFNADSECMIVMRCGVVFNERSHLSALVYASEMGPGLCICAS